MSRCRSQRKTVDLRGLQGISVSVSADTEPALLLPPHLHRVTRGRPCPVKVESTLLLRLHCLGPDPEDARQPYVEIS